MKVWLLCYTESNCENHVYRAFSSEEKGIEYMKKYNLNPDDYWFDDLEIDPE